MVSSHARSALDRRLIAVALGVLLLAPAARGEAGEGVPAPGTDAAGAQRVEILLAIDRLPAADRERLADRRQAIADAIASGLPLWRSFDPRETIAETLAELARHGADLGDTAIVNFDSLEVDVPAAQREALAALPVVRTLREPMIGTPSGQLDSEGIEELGTDLVNLTGVTGLGIKVAIIDPDWKSLAETGAAGDLPVVPTSLQYDVPKNFGVTTTITTPVSIAGSGEREHGTAAAEVVHEIAPDATLLLYRLNNRDNGLLGVAAVQAAIRHAAGQGADVILVPVHFLGTMSDPRGLLEGGTNPFTDEIEEAKAVGATVVVPGGNEALRHWSGKFTPCTECFPFDDGGLCNQDPDDKSYHIFDEEQPINEITIDDDHDDYWYNDGAATRPVSIRCYSATDAVDPSKFRMQLFRFRENWLDETPPDYPVCPNDPGTQRIANVALGNSSWNEITLYDTNFDWEDYYFVAVQRLSGTEEPNFRINCTVAAAELLYVRPESSLSDLAVVADALSVAAGTWPGFDFETDESSHGPSADPLGPMKPDLMAPGEVTNYAVVDAGFAFSETFYGTSAAASHVAGIVALMQSYQLENGLAPLTVDEVKDTLFASAIELDGGDPELAGPDPIYGNGLVQVPSYMLPEPTPSPTPSPTPTPTPVVTPTPVGTATSTPGGPTSTPVGPTPVVTPSPTPVHTPIPTLAPTPTPTAIPTPTPTAQPTAAPTQSPPPTPGPTPEFTRDDYDGDRRADPATYESATGMWRYLGSTNGVQVPIPFGTPGLKPVPADYDGDKMVEVALYDRATGTWHVSGQPSVVAPFAPLVPSSVILPAPADYDGDGKADLAVYDSGPSGPGTVNWHIRRSSDGQIVRVGLGGDGFLAVPADYDGDEKADIAVYGKTGGEWFILYSGGGSTSFKFGGGGRFSPVPADYDGDGVANPALYQANQARCRVRQSSEANSVVNVTGVGGKGFIAVPGDYDGDGRTDCAAYKRGNGNWRYLASSSGVVEKVNGFGGDGFAPVVGLRPAKK